MFSGYLIVNRADDCSVCRELNKETPGKKSFFKELLKFEDDESLTGILDRVIINELKAMGPIEDLPAIFNIDVRFPNFKYMSENTYQKAMKSGDNYRFLLNEIRFFNRRFEGGQLVPYNEYPGPITYETIIRFCRDSADILGVVPRSKNINIVQRHRSDDSEDRRK